MSQASTAPSFTASMAQPRLVFASENEHKLGEINEILALAFPSADLSGLVSMSKFAVPTPVENGTTFAENAKIKAKKVAQATGLPAFADDSGLAVDVLGGAPGVFSARWCGRHGDDVSNRRLLLAQLADVPESNRLAHFECSLCVAIPRVEQYRRFWQNPSQFMGEQPTTTTAEDSHFHYRWFAGRLSGRLLLEERGQQGFGYDPIFLPAGFTLSTAEMSATQKNAISHRSIAVRAAGKLLVELLKGT